MEYPSLIEWMEKINFSNLNQLKSEELEKRDRVKKLSKILKLTAEHSFKFKMTEILKRTRRFKYIIGKINKYKKISFRVIPLNENLPKLRTQGKNLKRNFSWLQQKTLNPREYTIEIIPHENISYSGIIIINNNGVFGSFVKGMHWQLTRGKDEDKVKHFSYHLKKLKISEDKKDEKTKKIINTIINKLTIKNDKQKLLLKKQLGSTWNKENCLNGYFEIVVLKNKNKIVILDYNRMIGKKLKQLELVLPDCQKNNNNLYGINASPGKVHGKVKILKNQLTKINKGEILVAKTIFDLSYIPLIKKAKGIITEQGNILSHFAIAARELKKPCLVQVCNATKYFKNGDYIKMDANTGLIEKINT